MNPGGTAASRRRARVAALERAQRSRRAGRLVAAAALALPVLTVAALVAMGLGPAPRSAGSPTAADAPAQAARLDLRPTPAESVVRGLLGSLPPGWSPEGPVASAASDPLTEGCEAATPAAAVSAARRADVAGQVVGVRVSVFGAGLGGVAIRDALAAIQACPGAGARTSSAPGLDAAAAWRVPQGGRPQLGAVMWRRGDVVVSLLVSGRTVDGLASLASQLDQSLVRALGGRCAETASTAGDSARTPYRKDGAFTGLLEAVPVEVPAVPDPAAGLAAPSPPPTVSYPARPADPVSPSALPAPVTPPAVPLDPGPQPTSTSVAQRRPDPIGPGCGWSFTGQVPPVFDPAEEALRVQAAVAQAQADLAAMQQQWTQARAALAAQSAVYLQQLEGFLAYVERVRQVAEAWDALSAARADYAVRLAEYEAAVAALDQWWRDRAAAQIAYEAAVDACQASEPDPLASPTPEPSSAPASPSAPCPPPLPAILQEAPPTVPASPVPASG